MDNRPARPADRFEHPDLVGLLSDERHERIEDENGAQNQGDDCHDLQDERERIHENSAPVFVRILVLC